MYYKKLIQEFIREENHKYSVKYLWYINIENDIIFEIEIKFKDGHKIIFNPNNKNNYESVINNKILKYYSDKRINKIKKLKNGILIKEI